MNDDATFFSRHDQSADPPARNCRFPGCEGTPDAAVGPGRPSVYCSRPDHNPQTASRARRDLGTAPNIQTSVITTSHDNDDPINNALEDAKEVYRALCVARDVANRVVNYLQAGDPVALKAQLRAVTRELVETTAERDELRCQLDVASSGLSDIHGGG